jgi:hypothetical protein
LPRHLDAADVRAWAVDGLRLREPRIRSGRDSRLHAWIDRVGERLIEHADLHDADRFDEPLEEQIDIVRARRLQIRVADAHRTAAVLLEDEWRQVAEVRTRDAHSVHGAHVGVLIEGVPILHARQHVRVGPISGDRRRRHIVPRAIERHVIPGVR